MEGVARHGAEKNSSREALLKRLGEASTARPLDLVALKGCADKVEKELSREALVEAAGVVGIFECFTRFADATGKKPIPSSMLSVMSVVLGSLAWIRSFFI